MRRCVARYKARLPAHINWNDLESAASYGLFRAALLFDPARGRWLTYAKTWIVSEMRSELRRPVRRSGYVRAEPLGLIADELLISRDDTEQQVLARERLRELARDGPDPGAPSEREMEVLACAAAGLTNREIGEQLGISENTVKSHVKTLLLKLHARNQTHAVAVAYEQGLLPR